MGFLNKKYTTQGLYLGKPEAEAENVSQTQNLLAFFEDYQNISNSIEKGCFIITGRKGAGKSAYAGWLIEKSESEDMQYCSLIKKNEFDLETMIQSIPFEGLRFEALFEWIVLVRIVKLIIDSRIGNYLKEYRALTEFYNKNSGLVNIDRYVINEILANKEINFSPLKKNFGFISNILGTKSIKAPFFNMITPLRETIRKVLNMEIYANAKFYILFDDLDVKFKLSREKDKVMLMDLIRVARRYNTEYLKNTSAKILIFLRDDIGDRLEGVDCDKNKIFSSYEYCINWYEHNIALQDEKNIMLRKFINKRLSVGFKELGIPFNEEDPWLTFVAEDIKEQKSSFKYILDYTFYLPRDIITIFKNVGNKNLKLPLSHNDINILLREYSKIKKKELVDELVAIYEKEYIDNIFSFLKELNNGWNVSYSEALNLLEKHQLQIGDWQNLIDYCLLVPVDRNGHMFYNYREQVISEDFEKYTFRTPKILSLYFQQR